MIVFTSRFPTVKQENKSLESDFRLRKHKISYLELQQFPGSTGESNDLLDLGDKIVKLRHLNDIFFISHGNLL